MGQLYAIGDIHGCYDKLEVLLEKVDIDFLRDTLIFMGDYIDRGLQVFEVVDFLVHLKKTYPNIIFLKGNHEVMLERYRKGESRNSFIVNGGRQTLESYHRYQAPEDEDPFPKDHLAFFDSLQHYYETDSYIFVHAGIIDKISLKKQKEKDLFWIRKRFIRSEADFGKRVIFGHTPFSEPFIMHNKIGIDTGAVYGNKLTCIKLPQLEFYSA